jgi:hypothetical protein
MLNLPTQVEPTGYFETSYDGTKDFAVSPYFFETNSYISSSLHAQALTDFRIEFYNQDGKFLFFDDAQKYGITTPTGQSYYIVDRNLFESDAPLFYFVILNRGGENTLIQGSLVQIWHKTLSLYGVSPPTQQVKESEFYWTHDGTTKYSYSPYYFKNSYYNRIANGFDAGAKTNFRLEFYDLSQNYLGYMDANFSNVNLNFPYTVSSPNIPGNPEYYYMILVNMQGDGTQVSGNLMTVKGGN